MIHFLSKRNTMNNYSSFLENTFLFKGIGKHDIDNLISEIKTEEKSYLRGEVIFSPEDYERKLGFVLLGECTVGRQSGGSFVPLNTLHRGESFGILSVFSVRDEFPTVIKAKNACSILFFSADDTRLLAEKNSCLSMNVIEFLVKKINFLNDKIASFSGGSVEKKLAAYILEQKKKYSSLSFDFNKKKSAEELNCGRASLYRAIATLEDNGCISISDKKINIIDLEGLERILK